MNYEVWAPKVNTLPQTPLWHHPPPKHIFLVIIPYIIRKLLKWILKQIWTILICTPTYFIVSSRAPGSLCSSLNAGTIKDMYFSAGSKTEGQGTYNKHTRQASLIYLKKKKNATISIQPSKSQKKELWLQAKYTVMFSKGYFTSIVVKDHNFFLQITYPNASLILKNLI